MRTVRDRARAEITSEIKATARRHVVASGAAALSLRAVARELEVAVSALYRYFPSRDALLTALIVDAYDDLGARAEIAAGTPPPGHFLTRWRAACHAVRAWALEAPAQYALVFGSPVPDYQAPADTIAAGSRVPSLLLTLVHDCWRAGQLVEPADAPPPSAGALQQAQVLADATGLQEVPAAALLRTVTAWTQLFGAISLELFGQLNGAFADNEAFFDEAVEQMARLVGLRDS